MGKRKYEKLSDKQLFMWLVQVGMACGVFANPPLDPPSNSEGEDNTRENILYARRMYRDLLDEVRARAARERGVS